MIKVRNLYKSFGDKVVLSGIKDKIQEKFENRLLIKSEFRDWATNFWSKMANTEML